MPGPTLRLPLPGGGALAAEVPDGSLDLHLDGRPLARFALVRERQHIALGAPHPAPDDAAFALWAACYWLFAGEPDCREVRWDLSQPPASALGSGLLVPVADGWLTPRELFWQLPEPWLRGPRSAGHPPLPRPPKPRGELYRRFDARLGQWISLRALEIEEDLDRFHRWQNTPRVLHFWQEGGTLGQHRAYLERQAADPHTLSLIGCFDDQPFAYFEAYWAKEDRIAPFYDAGDFDRGIHMLVGEETHRGPAKVTSWLGALVHYLFIDEPRTRTLVSEPRADNARMIAYLRAQGFGCLKEFDFPHKRAALMLLSREAFFERCELR
jgi:acetyl CoA:N6-hydroxylysine acetyl transferase